MIEAADGRNGRVQAPRKVGVLGATGMVGRRLARLLLHHPSFTLERVVGSDAAVGVAYRDVWESKEAALQEHYGRFWRAYSFPDELQGLRVTSFEELLASDCEVVFSSIPDRASELEERLLRSGRTVFSNSPYRRFDPDVDLVVPEVNAHAIGASRLIKNPNCVTSGLVIVLAALEARYGLREVVVTTYQSLSGRGDAKYAPELVHANIYPLHASAEGTEGYIRREVKKIVGGSFPISVTCNRTFVQEGHFVEVRVKTRAPVGGADEAADVLAGFNPLGDRGLPTCPPSPLVVLRESGRPRPIQDAHHHGGMAVAVGNVATDDEVFDLRLTYVVNNLVRGAAGGALLNAEVWQAARSAPTALTGAAARPA